MANDYADPSQPIRNGLLQGRLDASGNMVISQGRNNYQASWTQLVSNAALALYASNSCALPINGNIIQIDGSLSTSWQEIVTGAISTNSNTGISPGDVFQVTATTVSNILVNPGTNSTMVLMTASTTALSNALLTSAKVWDCVVPPAGGKIIIKNY